jgi:hypothetical protein
MHPIAGFAFVLHVKVRNVERANGLNRGCKRVVCRPASFSAELSSHRSQGAKHLRTIEPLSFAVIAKRHHALTLILRDRELRAATLALTDTAIVHSVE